MGKKKPGCGIDGTWNFGGAQCSSYGGRACGVEAASLSIGTLLGQSRPLYGGVFMLSTKRDSCLESKSYDIVHKNENLYPLDTYKNRKEYFKDRKL